uniref:C6 domain-containing protein n=1 Tax=Panagrolaimus davidi TaxID=227884 RepID=A0A914R784_9BILA
MKDFIISLIYWSFLICKGYGCLSTSSSSSPILVTTTTTTAATTTTTTVSDCTSCLEGQVTFEPMTTPDSEAAVSGGTGVDANGCSTLTAICPANPNAGLGVFMIFNNGLGGPVQETGTEVTAVLMCVNGQWTFTQGGVTSVITSVSCVIVTP